MELLVTHGADVNAEWNGDFPILFAPCESVDPVSLQWLLQHGADPNCPNPGKRKSALDYLIGSYVRSSELGRCIDLLINAGAVSQYNPPHVLETIQGRADRLAERLDKDAALVNERIPGLDCGNTGGRRLMLHGTTLLHVAAEYGSTAAAQILITRGADVNARAEVDSEGVGGQTPIFHSVTQFEDWGLKVTQLLLDHGADLSVRVKLPGHYERPDEIVECTPLGYALRFPGTDFPGTNRRTVMLLQERGGLE
jgi:hypothetical protein